MTCCYRKLKKIEIQYTDADVVILDEDTLVLDFWDEAAGSWVDAATTCDPASQYTRQPGQNKLSVDICHLTPFALLGETEQSFLPILLR